MMDDLLLIKAIERYLDGQMLPDEKAFFESLRKSKPDIDQMVVEHRLFLHQMENYSDVHEIKHSLHQTHNRLLQNGDIIDSDTPPTAKGKVVQLYHKYKRVTAIAASIACLTALVISTIVTYFTPAINDNQIQQLYHQLNQVQRSDRAQNEKLREFDSKIPAGSVLTAGGTAFMINGDGYLITNAHVLKGSGAVVINNAGQEFKARIYYTNLLKDLAVLKIEDKDFKSSITLPYSIRKSGAELGEELFTLGYPRNEIVYNMGYLSAESGYDGDTSSFQISLNANPGNSGGPVFNRNGEIVGILSTRQMQAEGVVFAIKAKNIYNLVNEFKKTDSVFNKIGLPSGTTIINLNRVDQIKALEGYVYQVKAYSED